MSNYGIMLDLETCGVRATSAIISIGATLMNLKTLQTERYFYKAVDMDSSRAHKMTVDPGTMLWWQEQSDEAKKVFSDPERVTLPTALFEFSEFIGDKSETIKVFGNGSDFDNAILAYAYSCCDIKAPWEFYNSRCYRTIKAMHTDVPRHKPVVIHDALSDAIAQTNTLYDIIKLKSIAL